MQIRILFEPRDLWVGLYWTRQALHYPGRTHLTIFLCLIPMLPIRIRFGRPTITAPFDFFIVPINRKELAEAARTPPPPEVVKSLSEKIRRALHAKIAEAAQEDPPQFPGSL